VLVPRMKIRYCLCPMFNEPGVARPRKRPTVELLGRTGTFVLNFFAALCTFPFAACVVVLETSNLFRLMVIAL
jgi:hypothetical protein